MKTIPSPETTRRDLAPARSVCSTGNFADVVSTRVDVGSGRVGGGRVGGSRVGGGRVGGGRVGGGLGVVRGGEEGPHVKGSSLRRQVTAQRVWAIAQRTTQMSKRRLPS